MLSNDTFLMSELLVVAFFMIFELKIKYLS